MSSGVHVIGEGDSEGLRKVEKDVLIPKKVRKKAHELCGDLVKEFEDCVRGRTVSVIWKCRVETKNMNECLTNKYKDTSLHEECKKEYLLEREEYRRTGVTKHKIKRTE